MVGNWKSGVFISRSKGNKSDFNIHFYPMPKQVGPTVQIRDVVSLCFTAGIMIEKWTSFNGSCHYSLYPGVHNCHDSVLVVALHQISVILLLLLSLESNFVSHTADKLQVWGNKPSVYVPYYIFLREKYVVIFKMPYLFLCSPFSSAPCLPECSCYTML